ncbi:MAG: hypothetical protein JNK33_01055 [Candidatus Doudnabacteria bacterium]|nr:hypothetical protein [Candidatus Doudnabacteria bacterium]
MKHTNTPNLPAMMPGIDGPNPDLDMPRLLPFVPDEVAHNGLEALPTPERAAVDQSIADLEARHPELEDTQPGYVTLEQSLGSVATVAASHNTVEASAAPEMSEPDLMNGASFTPADTIQVAHLLNGLPDHGVRGVVGSRRLQRMRETAARRRELAIHHSMSGSDHVPLPDGENVVGANKTITDIRNKNGLHVQPPEFSPREQRIIISLALAEAAQQNQRKSR